jgi:hypothetical protein
MGPIERIAECCGLWLAEGSTTSTSEITFTNNCLELVDLFKRTINELFKNERYNQRIYVYSKTGEKVSLPYEDCLIKYYVHKRATKPFFIFRIASVQLMKKWNQIVKEMLENKDIYPYILRGFFAGEGNVHTGKRSVRVLRISQSKPKEFIDNLLKEFGIKFSFEAGNRNYILSGKSNWDIFAKFKLADLHPNKKEKFWRAYNSFKEEHYAKNYIIQKIFPLLDSPYTSRQLSQIFNRSIARIQDVLIELKKQKKINNFRVGSTDYWTKDLDLIIISKIKNQYLLFLNCPKETSEFAKYFKVNWKSSFKRLKELQRLSLVTRRKDGKWIKLPSKKKILAI